MKKNNPRRFAVVSLLVGGLVFTSPLGLVAEANTNEAQQQNETEVMKLTIDEAVERALKNDRNIVILGYQYELLKLEKEMSDDMLADLEDARDQANSLPFAPTDFDVVLQIILAEEGISYEDYENDPAIIDPLVNERIENNRLQNEKNRQIAEEANQELTPKIDNLRDGLKQNEVNDEQFQLQLEETKEGIRYMMKARYMELLSLNESLDMQKSVLATLRADILKAELEREIGVASAHSVNLLKRDVTKQENEYKKNQNNYELQVRKFLLDLGLSPTQKVELTEPDFHSLQKINQAKAKATEETYLAKSYSLKQIEQDLDKLDYDRDRLYDNENDYTHYQDDIIDQQININLERKKQIEQDIQKHVASLYKKAEEAYHSLQEKRWDAGNNEEDQNKLALQYELGLISKHEYEKAAIANKQAAFEEKMAQITYYLALEEIAIVEKGILFMN